MGTVQTVPCPSCQHPIAAAGFKSFAKGRGAIRALYIGGILAGQRAGAVNCTQERMETDMRLLKLPLKLLALPLILALYTLHIIGKLASNLSAYVVGLFMLVILACGIYQVCVREWLNVAILFGVEAVCVALQFSAMLLVELAGEWAGSLGAFLHS